MYERLGRMLAENGTRLVYTTNRVVHGTLKGIQKEYLSFEALVSLNEKIALELALAGSYASKKTGHAFFHRGIYEALDPLDGSAYTGVLGGYLILCVRQTEERVTPVGVFSKVPVIVAEEREFWPNQSASAIQSLHNLRPQLLSRQHLSCRIQRA